MPACGSKFATTTKGIDRCSQQNGARSARTRGLPRGIIIPFISTIAIALCCGGEIYGLFPFGTSMFCAMSTRVFFVFTAPVYILFSFIYSFELWRLYAALAAVFVMSTQWALSVKVKKADSPIIRAVFSCVAIVVNGILTAVFDSIVSGALTAAVGMLFYAFASPSSAVLIGRFSAKPSAAEAISLCAVLMCVGLTLSRFNVGIARIGLGVAFCFMLFSTALGAKSALAGGVAIAVGLALKFGGDVAIILLIALSTAIAFSGLMRWLHAAIAVMLASAVSVLLGTNTVAVGFDALVLTVGAIPYCVVPKKAMNAIKSYFDFDGTARLAVRHYINRSRADSGNKLLCVAAAFDESARLISAFGAEKNDSAAVASALGERFCPYCVNKASCDIFARESAFLTVAKNACEGKTVMGELPEFFISSCVRTAEIISACTDIAESAKKTAVRLESERAAKEIVTERMTAVKELLASLGKNQALPVGFDGDAETYVKRELSLAGMECAEAFVTAAGVTAILRTAAADKTRIERAVSVALKKKYEVRLLEPTQAAGWSVAECVPRPAYEAVYARVGVSKDGGVSGDSYAFKRIDGKFLVALADGMGSGEAAGAGSDSAVELIECFYRAGFDSQSVLTGVNRFLKLPGAERYSAADVAVCDLDTAAVDIIKMGSPPCFIKTADTVLRLEGGALPIGVLEEMRPYTVKKRLYPGQMLIMMSDGVSDCFEGDTLPDYINGISAHNPESAASAILRRALENIGGTPRDDMTVVAFRVCKRK